MSEPVDDLKALFLNLVSDQPPVWESVPSIVRQMRAMGYHVSMALRLPNGEYVDLIARDFSEIPELLEKKP